MNSAERVHLWDCMASSGAVAAGQLRGRRATVALAELQDRSFLGPHLETLRDRAVLIATRDQLPTATTLIELDGVARRMVLCTPDLGVDQLAAVARTAAAGAVVLEPHSDDLKLPPAIKRIVLAAHPMAVGPRRAGCRTEWILLTSGTTGTPKLVVHTLQSLCGALPGPHGLGARSTWSTFYDIRRYGGLQIYLRAMLAGAPLVLSSAGEPPADFLARAAAAGVTHISGTPSHWRGALMSGRAGALNPQYVRLSGEVADQSILDNLRAAYPRARIAHAFASTEAGVAFDVNDGIAGFPMEFLEGSRDGIEMKVVGGTLRIRSGRTAAGYLGDVPPINADADGYLDTGDMVELVGERYYFRGRVGGVINVGGLKVYPEEVESVLNADPRVRMSLVRPKRSPITGAIVVADVVLADPASPAGDECSERLKADLLDACRRSLAAHKVPAMLRFVPALEFTAAGKLVRPHA